MDTPTGAPGVWWAKFPALPNLGLPPPGDPDVMVVVSVVLAAMGLTALLSARIDGRRSYASLFATGLAAALMAWVWESDREGFGWLTVPMAFVELLARVIR
ncbi:hypothetical protein MWU52_10005 [Jannaschia sp. S6380]|uniref:hypothetical protein n=1 Tax=Jannaschia sp. S6380 TaxID=2926408 RepID=UPI001FF315B1|nr:hypothetical protein [Jannaschia sp. S6380]MCK0167881.1 hypothetical protein [Jannaschia sp. S6380]